jgi:hypothetical protein
MIRKPIAYMFVCLSYIQNGILAICVELRKGFQSLGTWTQTAQPIHGSVLFADAEAAEKGI